MYNVLLVDDEPWVTYGLKNLIDWEELGFKVIAEAHNGTQALEIILDEKPDVVVADIRMPGLNGIELMEEIKKNKLDIKVILISGYAEFEYARRAINLGAFEYLLKQVEKEKLIDVLERLATALMEKRQNEFQLQMNIDDFFELLKTGQLTRLSDFINERNIKFLKPNFRFISCLIPGEQKITLNKVLSIKEKELSYIYVLAGRNKFFILINYDAGMYPDVPYYFIVNQLSQATCVGMSGIGDEESYISWIYNEAEIALNTEMFIPLNGAREYKVADAKDRLPSILIQIEQSFKDCNIEQTLLLIDNFYSECKEGNYLVDKIVILYNQLVTFLYKYYPQRSISNEVEYYNYYQIVDNYKSIDRLFHMIRAIFENQDQYDYTVTNNNIKKIMNEIDERFTEDISLQYFSQKYNISIGYLSSQIKNNTGHTYTEHITYKRLENAKKLLKNDLLSIGEIAEKVGYNDYFYFTKLFKKYYDCTPSKYRKLLK